MVQEAEQFAEDDKKRRDSAEARNNADSLIHSTERQLEEHGDKVEPALKAEIQTAVDEAKAAVESGEAGAIQQKAQALAQIAMKLGQAIYEKEQATAAGAGDSAEAPAGGGAGSDEEVVDAEFSEVDEDNKG
jgi:molecular chaperone DnaK